MELRPLSPLDMGPIAHTMRRWDRVECAAMGMTPKGALRLAMRSGAALSVRVEGKVVGAVGVHAVSLAEGRACVWGLFTTAATRHARLFVTEGPKVLGALSAGYDVLENVVCADNTAAVRWLAHMGFDVMPVEEREDGYRFRRIRLCVAQQR